MIYFQENKLVVWYSQWSKTGCKYIFLSLLPLNFLKKNKKYCFLKFQIKFALLIFSHSVYANCDITYR